MPRRYYSSTAVETTLAGSASNVATSITVTALSGFPNTTPWTAILDADTASEEVVEVTNVAGTTLTVTRGVDGTAAVAHNAGASFRHGVSARDFDEANDHVNDSTGVHGLGSSSAVVGTTDAQTLTNKTISGASNTISAIAQASVTNLTTDLGNKANAANPTFTGVAQFPDGSASAPSITNTGDTNTGLFHPADDTLAISTGGTERVRVDSSGRLGLGTTAPAERLTIQADGAAHVSHVRYSANATPQNYTFVKGRGTNSSKAIVENQDYLGSIFFAGYDGAAVQNVVWIAAQVDGTPGAGDMPSRLVFFTTPDGTTTLTERMRIDSNGLITGTGTSLGAWTSFTPSLTATTTNPTLGSAATQSGLYTQIGKVVIARYRVRFGTSGAAAGSGTYEFSLPITAKEANFVAGAGWLQDESAGARRLISAFLQSTTALRLVYEAASGYPAVTEAAPYAWAASDQFIFTVTYEAA